MASSSSLASRLKFAGLLILGIALFALVMMVMGTRLDNQDVTPTPASPAEQERQELAQTAGKIHASATSLGHTDLVSASAEWLDSLGGVWLPWPDGAPEGYTNPPVETGPVRTDDELIDILSTWSTSLMEAENPDPASTSSIAFAVVFHEAELSDAPTCETPDLALVGRAIADGVSLERFETARQWLEQSAAKLEPGERDADIARIDMLTDVIESAIDAGAPDTRPAMAPGPHGDPIEDAYGLLMQQLVVVASRSDVDTRLHLLNFACVLATTEDAPGPGVVPGPGASD